MRIQPIAALLVVSLAGVGCKRETAGPAQRGLAEVRTVAAWTGSVERVARAVGQIRAVESVTVAAEVEGTVRVVHFQEGGAVNAGDVLVELDDSRARAELAAAEARRDRAARQMERYEQAATTSAASTTELDTVRTELREADAEYELAKIRVEDHTIEAPFAGRVGLRMVSPGAFIQAGDALTTLTTIDPVEIEFTVPEVFLADLRPGLEVAATSAAFTDRSFRSVVQVVSPQVDPSTRSVLVLAVTPNPDGLLRPGMFVNVRLVLGTRENAVMVPEAAIEFQGSLAMLYTVQGEQAKRRSVKIGERREGTVEVIEGLSEGDVVVTQGLQKIRDGSPVRAVPDADARASTAAEVEGNG